MRNCRGDGQGGGKHDKLREETNQKCMTLPIGPKHRLSSWATRRAGRAVCARDSGIVTKIETTRVSYQRETSNPIYCIRLVRFHSKQTAADCSISGVRGRRGIDWCCNCPDGKTQAEKRVE